MQLLVCERQWDWNPCVRPISEAHDRLELNAVLWEIVQTPACSMAEGLVSNRCGVFKWILCFDINKKDLVYVTIIRGKIFPESKAACKRGFFCALFIKLTNSCFKTQQVTIQRGNYLKIKVIVSSNFSLRLRGAQFSANYYVFGSTFALKKSVNVISFLQLSNLVVSRKLGVSKKCYQRQGYG